MKLVAATMKEARDVSRASGHSKGSRGKGMQAVSYNIDDREGCDCKNGHNDAGHAVLALWHWLGPCQLFFKKKTGVIYKV
jgi:hypothetical protein